MTDYICVNECYYLEKLWKPGDSLPPGEKPNKHFMDPKTKITKKVVLTPVIAGDDPRSTHDIINDIDKKYNVKIDADTSRKEAFSVWHKLEKDQPKENQVSGKNSSETVEYKKEVKPLSMWSPDEIDSKKASEISDLFGVSYVGKSKETLIEEIIKAE